MEEILFPELPELNADSLDISSDELMIYHASEADSEKKVKRISLEAVFRAFQKSLVTALSLSTSQVNVSVYGGTNGSITATGYGGSGSYQYSIDGVTWTPAKATSHTFTELGAGAKTVQVRDAGNVGNLVSKAVNISQPAQVQITTPAAPTSPITDDAANTFNWTNNPSFEAISNMEQTLDGGATVTALVSKPITLGNVAKAGGQVGVRVKAGNNRNASAWLFNSAPFTVAQATVPNYNTELNASKTEGAGVSFTPKTTERLLFDAIAGANQQPINSMFTYNGATSFATLPGEFLGKPYSFFDNAGVRHEGTFSNNG